MPLLGRIFLTVLLALIVTIVPFHGGATESVRLVLQYTAGPEYTDTVIDWISEFEAQYPQIKVEYLPTTDGFASRTMVAWASGIGPDVSLVYGDWGQDWARSGILMDLRPLVERDFTSEDIADFWPIAWDACHVNNGDYQGVLYCIPRYAITLVNYHNLDHFAGAGLVPPTELDEVGGWTYEALREAARKLMVTNAEGEVTRFGYTLNPRDYRRVNVWIRAFGGDLFDPNDPHRFIGGEEPAVLAIDTLQEMIWQERSTARHFPYRSFYTGGVSMVEDGNHGIVRQVEREIGGAYNWDVVPAPIGPNGRQAYSADNGWVIPRTTRHPEEAWKLVKFLASKEGQEIMIRHEGVAPVRLSAMEFYQEMSPSPNMAATHIKSMLDTGLPVTTLLSGDIRGIANTLNDALRSVLIYNEKSWSVAVSEIKDTLEGLSWRN